MNKYNIDELIIRCQDLDYKDLIEMLEQEYKREEAAKTPKDKDDEYKRRKYVDFIHESLFFLHSGIKPIGMRDEDFCKTKPIVENLVKKGQLNLSVLVFYP